MFTFKGKKKSNSLYILWTISNETSHEVKKHLLSVIIIIENFVAEKLKILTFIWMPNAYPKIVHPIF